MPRCTLQLHTGPACVRALLALVTDRMDTLLVGTIFLVGLAAIADADTLSTLSTLSTPTTKTGYYGRPPCDDPSERPFTGVGFDASACGYFPCATFRDCPDPPSGVSARPTCTSSYCVLACGELVGGDCDTPNTGAQCYDIGGLGVGVCLHPNLDEAAVIAATPLALDEIVHAVQANHRANVSSFAVAHHRPQPTLTQRRRTQSSFPMFSMTVDNEINVGTCGANGCANWVEAVSWEATSYGSLFTGTDFDLATGRFNVRREGLYFASAMIRIDSASTGWYVTKPIDLPLFLGLLNDAVYSPEQVHDGGPHQRCPQLGQWDVRLERPGSDLH